MTTLPLSSADFTEGEIEVAEALLLLSPSPSKAPPSSESLHRPVTSRLPRWGNTKRRSVHEVEQENKAEVQRLSPSTPLSFSPSGGDETPSPPPPLPARPPLASKIFKNKEQRKEWVKEQNKRVATLSATKAGLHQCVLEAKSRYQMLRETNSWLKEVQSKLKQRMLQLYERRSTDLDLFPVRHTWPAADHHQRQQLDLNRRTAEEEAAEWRQQRAAAYALARKRRRELQRVKSSLKIQRLR